MSKDKKNKGITLIALIITIIIVLILASVSIAVLSNSGIIKKSKFAGENYQNKINEEEKAMQNYTTTMNEYSIANSRDYNFDKKTLLLNKEISSVGTYSLLDNVNNYNALIIIGKNKGSYGTSWVIKEMYSYPNRVGLDDGYDKCLNILFSNNNAIIDGSWNYTIIAIYGLK